MKLTRVTINKYKSFDSPQNFAIDPKVTILVGKNESGKTAALEAIAKSNYFTDDGAFKFDDTHDYPRKEKKRYDKSEAVAEAITCFYEFTDDEVAKIEEIFGKNVLSDREFSITTKYDNSTSIGGIGASKKTYCDHIFKKYGVSKKEIPEISETTSKDEMCELLNKAKAAHAAVVQEENTQAKTEGRAPTPLDNPPLLNALEEIRSNLSGLDWANWVDAKIWSDHIKSIRPKFMYFDEYYELPGRIHINHIAHHPAKTEEEKTAKALLELADIDTDEVLSAHNFENFVAELEATSSEITQHIFKYWKNNSGLRVQFQVEPHATDKYLNIRVWNDKHHISLPLANRSKGFNWFFSFIVWFSRIQEDKNHDYILLLDEPGLNLHAAAQADLLRFIEDLCADYQVVYTTHSPFMVPPGKLERVRTIYEDKEGSEIKEAIQQKDADTLFPLQAALGYDIAQNLFINKKNLLVEGPSDLIYLTMMSSVLEGAGKKGLCEDITIVPVGGLDKVTSFISLLRGQKLSIVCLLDTFTDQKGKKRLEDLVMLKIIKDKDILFFDQFADLPGDVADLEDLFEKSEYLRFFNEAFNEHSDIQMKDIDDVDGPLLPQINRHIGKTRFNHYRPASCANSLGLDAGQFSDNTLRRFEAAIAEVNRRFA